MTHRCATLPLALLLAGAAWAAPGCAPQREEPPKGGDEDAGGDPEGDSDVVPGEVDFGDVELPSDPALVTLHGPCPLSERLGGFKVEMNEDVGYTAIDGVVRDGVVPNQVPEEALVEGDCRLLRRRRLVCDPSCEPGFTCGFAQSCVPMPLGQNMGTALLRGLVQPVTLQPIQPGNTYFHTRLPHPGFLPGALIQLLTSRDGFLGILELYGVGVAPLELGEERWVLTEGQPLTLHWTPPAEGARSRVYLEVNIDLHGLTPLLLVCDLPDTGEATLSQSVIDGLVQAGVTGFPSGRALRRTVDSLSSDAGCTELVIASVRAVDVEVTGHVPCARDEDCPPPLHCRTEIQQCE